MCILEILIVSSIIIILNIVFCSIYLIRNKKNNENKSNSKNGSGSGGSQIELTQMESGIQEITRKANDLYGQIPPYRSDSDKSNDSVLANWRKGRNNSKRNSIEMILENGDPFFRTYDSVNAVVLSNIEENEYASPEAPLYYSRGSNSHGSHSGKKNSANRSRNISANRSRDESDTDNERIPRPKSHSRKGSAIKRSDKTPNETEGSKISNKLRTKSMS